MWGGRPDRDFQRRLATPVAPRTDQSYQLEVADLGLRANHDTLLTPDVGDQNMDSQAEGTHTAKLTMDMLQ